MRIGVIVYMLDNKFPIEREPEMAAAVKSYHQADQVEIVSQGQRHYDVMDAWWKLTAKGMQKFVFMLAKSQADIKSAETIKPPGRNYLKLCK